MRTLKMLALCGIAVLFAGCVPSINQLYTEKELVFKEELLGTWLSPDDGDDEEKELWTFEKSGDKSYELTIAGGYYVIKKYPRSAEKMLVQGKYEERALEEEKDVQTAIFDVHLVKLGDLLFIDFFPQDTEPVVLHEFYRMHSVPAHNFAKFTIEKDLWRMNMLNPDWLDEKLKEKKNRLDHKRIDDGVFLTASTKKLQKFFRKYGKEEGAFLDPSEFHRQK